MSGGGSSAPPPDYSGYASSYSQWFTDALATREQTIGYERSRMAMSGLDPSSELWSRSLTNVQAASEADIASLRGGYTATQLQADLTRFRNMLVSVSAPAGAPPPTTGGGARPGMEPTVQAIYGMSTADIQSGMRDVSSRFKDAYGVDLEDWEAFSMTVYGEPVSKASPGYEEAQRVTAQPLVPKTGNERVDRLFGFSQRSSTASPWVE